MQIIIVQTAILLFQRYPLNTQGRGVYRNICFKNPHVLINPNSTSLYPRSLATQHFCMPHPEHEGNEKAVFNLSLVIITFSSLWLMFLTCCLKDINQDTIVMLKSKFLVEHPFLAYPLTVLQRAFSLPRTSDTWLPPPWLH